MKEEKTIPVGKKEMVILSCRTEKRGEKIAV